MTNSHFWPKDTLLGSHLAIELTYSFEQESGRAQSGARERERKDGGGLGVCFMAFSTSFFFLHKCESTYSQ